MLDFPVSAVGELVGTLVGDAQCGADISIRDAGFMEFTHGIALLVSCTLFEFLGLLANMPGQVPRQEKSPEGKPGFD